MLTEDAFKLLKKTPPFSFLDNTVLKNMTMEMLMEFYPKGRTIYRQDGPAAEHLRIIQNGTVKVFVRTNEGSLTTPFPSFSHIGSLAFFAPTVKKRTGAASRASQGRSAKRLFRRCSPCASWVPIWDGYGVSPAWSCVPPVGGNASMSWEHWMPSATSS